MTQLIQPDTSVGGRVGFCLEYAQNVYHTPHIYPKAWANWAASPTKHTDAIPGNVSVPCWFSFYQDGQNYGHVVAWVPGKGFYSSPWNYQTNHAVLGSIAEVERIYGAKYVGWSEDIGGVKVVTGGNMGVPDEDGWYARFRQLTQQIRGRDMSREEFRKSIVPARDPFNGVEALSDNPEAYQNTADAKYGRRAREQNLITWNSGDTANFKGALGLPVNDGDKGLDGLDFKDAAYKLVQGAEFADKQRQLKENIDNLQGIADQRFKNEKAIADLVGVENPDDTNAIVTAIQQLKNSTGGSGIDQATKDQITETNNIVKQIWDKIKGIFR